MAGVSPSPRHSDSPPVHQLSVSSLDFRKEVSMNCRFRNVLLSVAFTAFAASPVHAQASDTATPKLVLFITIDQMRPDYFTRFESQLTGGLGRLYRGGAFFTNAFQDHAITETAPGHSVTMAGRFPRSTGIVRNAAGVEDPQAPLLTSRDPGASPFRFRGSLLIDWLRIKDPRSRA